MEANKKITAGMIVLGACARLLPHPWNFTPMVAIALYSGAKSAKMWTGILATLAAMLISDAVIGFHSGMWVVYGALVVTVLAGRFVRERSGVLPIVGGAFVAGLLFFVITNFAVWVGSGMYPHTLAGLGMCFAAAIPFYGNQLASDAFYTAVLFGGHAVLTRMTEPQPQAA